MNKAKIEACERLSKIDQQLTRLEKLVDEQGERR